MDNAENQRAAQCEKAESHGDSGPNTKPLAPQNIENPPSEAGVLGNGYREREPQARKHHQHISSDGHGREISNLPERHPKDFGANFLNALAVVIAIFALAVSIKACSVSQTQADVTMTAFLGQQRPWVKIESASISPLVMRGTDERVPYSFDVTIKGLGPVPATNVNAAAYRFFPITNRDDERDLISALQKAVRGECASAQEHSNVSDHRVGVTLFPDDRTTLHVRPRTLDESSFVNGEKTIERLVLSGSNKAAIIFSVKYQSGIDKAVHCTAEAYKMYSDGGAPLFTANDILSGAGVCDILPDSIHIEEKGMGVGYAD